MKEIAIFGSTGSIGKNAIDVITAHCDKFTVKTLVARNDVTTLIRQALTLKPQYVVIEDETLFAQLKLELSSLKQTKILCGRKAILEVAKIKCDLVIAAISGAAGMLPTLEAIKAGSNIALANKESIICAGRFLTNAAKKHSVKIMPVDSEHNAIFQIFEQQNFSEISDIVLTASGGPFFNCDQDLSKVTVEQALKHPNWSMGKKITIDSATMMNKGLEMIEAWYLFDLKPQQITALVHPQSIVHGMVNYNDGSTLAMLSLPDMRIPIAHALSYPKRMKITHKKLDLAQLQNLTFFEPNHQKFPAIKLCQQAMNAGDSSVVVVNAANEIAVELFLTQKISFTKITEIVAKTLDKIPQENLNSIEEITLLDSKARQVASQLV